MGMKNGQRLRKSRLGRRDFVRPEKGDPEHRDGEGQGKGGRQQTCSILHERGEKKEAKPEKSETQASREESNVSATRSNTAKLRKRGVISVLVSRRKVRIRSLRGGGEMRSALSSYIMQDESGALKGFLSYQKMD